MTGRESGRIKDANQKRILDAETRKRRHKKALEALERDNFHDDPHADLGNLNKYLIIFSKTTIHNNYAFVISFNKIFMNNLFEVFSSC